MNSKYSKQSYQADLNHSFYKNKKLSKEAKGAKAREPFDQSFKMVSDYLESQIGPRIESVEPKAKSKKKSSNIVFSTFDKRRALTRLEYRDQNESNDPSFYHKSLDLRSVSACHKKEIK